MIEYVQRVTKSPKVLHVGHSMGTTTFYAMLSDKPAMNGNIAAHLSLAPVAYMSRMKSLDLYRPLLVIADQLLVNTVYTFHSFQDSVLLFFKSLFLVPFSGNCGQIRMA